MIAALQKDHYLLTTKDGGPALERIKIARYVDDLLRKKAVQAEFLDMSGLDVLTDWISPNPDGSYPLPQVVELVFDILERLPIDTRYLENSKIAKIVSHYANGDTELKYISGRALNIIQKWQAIVYNLSYKYDQDGFHEQKQRDLRERIQAIKARD